MTKASRRALLRRFAALFVVAATVLSRPNAVEGAQCGQICLYYCPTDKWEYCRLTFGSPCGLLAQCTSDDDCIAGVGRWLRCYDGPIE